MFKEIGVKVAHKPTNILGTTLSKVKDPIDNLEQAGVIYSIPCLNCDQLYIGETGKMLKSRLHEHFLAMQRGDNLSQLWNHCSTFGHEIALKDTTILAKSNVKNERLFLEAVFSNEKSYNRHIDVDTHMVNIARKSRRRRRGKNR